MTARAPGVAAPPPPDRFVSGRDVAAIIGLAFLLPAAWALPERHWPALCRALGRVIVMTGLGAGGSGRTLGTHIRGVLGERRISVDPDAIRALQVGNHVETVLYLLRSRRPVPPSLPLALEGGSHVDGALRAGRGAVLLFHRFRPFIHLAALSAAGFKVWRLSDEGHGYFSRTRVGRRWLNPLQIALEDKAGVERIVAVPGSLAHLRQLRDRLARNGIVVMPTNQAGTRTIEVQFMNGRLTWATTPFRLAADAGAPLLPLFTVSDRDGCYRVVVGAPIALHDGSGRPRPPEAVAAEHAGQLETYVLRAPEQWGDWDLVKVVGRPTATSP